MRTYRTCCFFTLLLIFVFIPNAYSDDVEIGTLVLNKTITRVGNEFYEAFADYWFPPKELGLMHVQISEAPSARWGSIIAVYVNGEQYFVTRLSSRERKIEDIAGDAVQQVMVSLARETLLSEQNGGTGDLVGDGL